MHVLLVIMKVIAYFIVGACLVYSDLFMFNVTRSSLQYNRAHSTKITPTTVYCLVLSLSSVVMDLLLIIDHFVGINAVRSALTMMADMLPFENSVTAIAVAFVSMGIVIAIRGIWLILKNFMSDRYCGDFYMCKACFLVHVGAIFMYIGAYTMSI